MRCARILVIARCTLLTLTAVSLMACQFGETPVTTLTENDNGRSIAINKDRNLQVVLTRDPQSGLEWDVQGYDATLLKLMPPSVDNGTPQPADHLSKQFFVFELRSGGTTTLRIVYHDHAHPEIPPTKTFEVTVTIK